LTWLGDLQLLHSIPKLRDTLSFEELIPPIQKGVILCDLVSTIEDNEILGVFRPPKTRSTAISNIVKALNVLKANTRMNPRYLSAEHEIYDGSASTILGLLQDIYNCYALPEKQLKTVKPSSTPTSRPLSPKITERKDTSLEMMDKFDILSTSSSLPAKVTTFSLKSSMEDAGMPRPKPQPHPYPKKVEEPQAPWVSPISNDKAYEISDWLRLLGVNISPSSFQKMELEEFRDGFLLCKITEILEHRIIEGLSKNPKSNASCLRNVTKVLEVLKENKNMPVEYLHSSKEIVKGDPVVIVALLEHLKKAYSHHYNTR